MKKIFYLLVLIFLLVGCSTNQAAPKEDEFLFSEVNDMEDVEMISFMWNEGSDGSSGSTNFYDDEMASFIDKIKNMEVREEDLDTYDIEWEQPNNYPLSIIHNTSDNIYTTLLVNDDGEVFIWNRYTEGETPSFYVSEENQEFYNQVAQIVEKESERNLNAMDDEEIEFEYKTEIPEQTSIFEVRSENGKLIADLSDIEQDSVEAGTGESGHPLLKLRFKDKDFVSHFTRAHIGEEIQIYVDGELISSVRPMQVIPTKEVTFSGDLDEALLDEMVKTIKEADE